LKRTWSIAARAASIFIFSVSFSRCEAAPPALACICAIFCCTCFDLFLFFMPKVLSATFWAAACCTILSFGGMMLCYSL